MCVCVCVCLCVFKYHMLYYSCFTTIPIMNKYDNCFLM